MRYHPSTLQNMKSLYLTFTLLGTAAVSCSLSQTLEAFPDNSTYKKIHTKYQHASTRFEKQTAKWIKKIKKQEHDLKHVLGKTDSVRASEIFGDIEETYKHFDLQAPKNVGKLKQYLPQLDSVITAVQFLRQKLPYDTDVQLLNNQLTALQGQIQHTNDLKRKLHQRKEYLERQLKNTPVVHSLKSMQCQIYYFQQQLNEYKALLNNPDQIVRRLVNQVKNMPTFKAFFKKHSFLSSLFNVPDNYGTVQSLSVLQTNATTSNFINTQLGTGISPRNGISRPFNKKLEEASLILTQLQKKNGLDVKTTSVIDSDTELWPKGGKRQPNTQKTKKFIERLQFGFNTQSQRNNGILPSITDLAVTVGYKMNNELTSGIGTSFKLGLGNGINDLRFSAQGIGLRSFIEGKLPKTIPVIGESIYLSANLEANYLPALQNYIELRNLNIKSSNWQPSFLLGLTKKVPLGKRSIRTQLLYNTTYTEQIPRTTPFLFRVGWETN